MSGASSSLQVDVSVLEKATEALKSSDIPFFGEGLSGDNMLIRLHDVEQQQKARSVIQEALGGEYIVTLNRAPTTPKWLENWGLPVSYLSGRVGFLLEVNTSGVVTEHLALIPAQLKTQLRNKRVPYRSVTLNNGKQLVVVFKTAA